MKFFRTYLIRFAGTICLLSGMTSYFLNPADKNGQHDEFAIWLQSHLKTQNNSDVAEKISAFSFSDEQFEVILLKASKLVQSHLQDFELPHKKDAADENEMMQLLLTEWNAFQDFSKGMGKAAIIKNAKPNSILPTGTLAFSGKFSIHQPFFDLPVSSGFEYVESLPQNFKISPLIGGTAIGAP